MNPLPAEKLHVRRTEPFRRLAAEVWGDADAPAAFLDGLQGTLFRFRDLTAEQGRALIHAAAASGARGLMRRDCPGDDVQRTDALLAGSPPALRRMAESLGAWGDCLEPLAPALRRALDGDSTGNGRVWRCRERALTAERRTLVMGVLNITPDSFSDGGLYLDPAKATDRALALLDEGADLLDIGAESSRPGARPTPPEEEIRRLRPVLQAVRRKTAVPISIDTRKASVAAEALDLGADIINDITALRGDPEMAALAAGAGAGVALMHMKGDPASMQDDPRYENVIGEIMDFLGERLEAALEAGIEPERIVLDPGIGFGKTVEHNLRILAHADAFLLLGRPVLVGPSRKSFIGKALGVETADRLEGTLAAVAAAVMQGASIVRAHDVKAVRRTVDLLDAIRSAA